MRYSASDIARITGGSVKGSASDRMVTAICTDSRRVLVPEKCAFFALSGPNFDGHNFIDAAYRKGIRVFVVKSVREPQPSDALYIHVKDPLEALQMLAAYHRSQFRYPVIGITGSNGKTIVKEWLFQLFQPVLSVIKSPKSYNSQLGVPLSVLYMDAHHELAIIEAGISQPDEMERLEAIIRPELGIITNLGPAHDAGFDSRRQKLAEKLKLFKGSGKIIYCRDHSDIHEILADHPSGISWGRHTSSDYVYDIRDEGGGRTLFLSWKEGELEFRMPFQDDIFAEDLLHALVTFLQFGLAKDHLAEVIRHLRNIPMRMELKYATNNCIIIDDSYSADFLSLESGLDFLDQQAGPLRRALILSAFQDSGDSPVQFTHRLEELLISRHLDRLVLIGPFSDCSDNLVKCVGQLHIFRDTEDFINSQRGLSIQDEIILIKGARNYGFERIVRELQSKSHKTVLEISLTNLVHNLNIYRSFLPSDTRIMAMVKAFSYGSGSSEIAYALQSANVDYLAVAYSDEGVHLRNNGLHIPILVMNPSADELEVLLENNLEPSIYSLSLLDQLIRGLGSFRRHDGRPLNVHLKIDTGMHRLGLDPGEVPGALEQTQACEHLRLASIFSHLSASEDDNEKAYTLQQIKVIREISDLVDKSAGRHIPVHILNSSGVINYPEFAMDMVRIGIGLYGIDTSGKVQDELLPVGTLKTRITQIRHIGKGDPVGYNMAFRADKEMTIATIAIGYADGFNRKLSKGAGKVFVKGHYAPVIGNICMDMSMVDISGIPGVREGDMVEVFGRNVSVTEAAVHAGTIPYELLTNISERVKRIYIGE